MSDEDYERTAQFKWCATHNARPGRKPKWYGKRKQHIEGKPVTIYLHRFIMECPTGLVVDHLDGDGLNCTRTNLVVKSQEDNTRHCRFGAHRKSEPCL